MEITESAMASPKYKGDPDEMLPHRLALTCPYLKTTPICNWDMQQYLGSGGDPGILLRNLVAITEDRAVARKIRAFAFTFYGHFTGELGAKRLQILRNEVTNAINRCLIEGNELTAGQDRVIDRQMAPSMARQAVNIEPDLGETEQHLKGSAGTRAGKVDSSRADETEEDGQETESDRPHDQVEQDPQVATADTATVKNGKKPGKTTTEPWRGLVFQLMDAVNEKETPRISATDCTGLSTNHSLLYRHSLEKINAYNAQESKAKDVLLLKQAQDSMSCCLNTMSEQTCSDFHEMGLSSLIDTAKEFATMPGFEDHPCNSILDKYLPRLKMELNVEKFKRFLIVERGRLNEQHLTLILCPKKCSFITKSPFGSAAPSENDCLSVWKSIFDIVIMKISNHTGEQMLEATKVIKRELSDEFGDISDSGRKCDLVFRYAGIDISNIEFKKADTSMRDLAIQSSKNVRLARCIQESCVEFGVARPSVLMGDVAGFVGAFYQLTYMGDIAIAGTTTSSTVQLPKSRGALLAFMQDKSLAMLFNYVYSLKDSKTRKHKSGFGPVFSSNFSNSSSDSMSGGSPGYSRSSSFRDSNNNSSSRTKAFGLPIAICVNTSGCLIQKNQKEAIHAWNRGHLKKSDPADII
ncbi:hypothetical protein BGZ99_008473 [Dissophora globulifera]|uniref:Uncharacterized protein n=1 Tax=Dissophora globulifera TaxID=979702 RepID=A0A9P6UPR1_9FUNG|nr:hypothetical protein BGZ99_008473 [Dissophora globulifera]